MFYYCLSHLWEAVSVSLLPSPVIPPDFCSPRNDVFVSADKGSILLEWTDRFQFCVWAGNKDANESAAVQ